MAGYGPNGQYETLNEYFNANPDAKRVYENAVQNAVKDAKINAINTSQIQPYKTSLSNVSVQPKYGTNCTTIGNVMTSVQPKYGTNCTTSNGIMVQPKYGTSCTTTTLVQPKYGTSCTTTTLVQPKYGTSCVQVQPAYGVQVVQPKYGTSCTYTDLNITYAQVEENISKLKKAVNTLKNTWDGETKANLQTINNSWAGEDCSAYTQKLSKMDSKVQNTISALDLLRTTYEQARDMVKESQQSSISSISKLEG